MVTSIYSDKSPERTISSSGLKRPRIPDDALLNCMERKEALLRRRRFGFTLLENGVSGGLSGCPPLSPLRVLDINSSSLFSTSDSMDCSPVSSPCISKSQGGSHSKHSFLSSCTKQPHLPHLPHQLAFEVGRQSCSISSHRPGSTISQKLSKRIIELRKEGSTLARSSANIERNEASFAATAANSRPSSKRSSLTSSTQIYNQHTIPAKSRQ